MSESKSHDHFDLDLLDGATCPITLTLMNDPVMLLGDGQTYERDAIESWLEQGHKNSPLTGVELNNFRLMPNYAMKSTIEQLRSRFSSKELQKMEAEIKPKLKEKSSQFVEETNFSFSNSPAPSAPLAPYEEQSFTGSSSSTSTTFPFVKNNYNDDSKEKDFVDSRNEEKEKTNGSPLHTRYALILAGLYGNGHVNDFNGGFETYVNETGAFDIWGLKHMQEISDNETNAVTLSGDQIMTGSGLISRIWAMEKTENAQDIAKNKSITRVMKRLLSKYVLTEDELAERQRKEELQLKEIEDERLRLEEESLCYPFNDPSWTWKKKVELTGHREKITCTSIAHNNTFAVSGGLDGRVLFWHPKVYDDNSTWTCKNNMFHGDDESPVRAVEIHGANSLENHIPEWYASGGDDWAVRIWDSANPDRLLNEYDYSAHTLAVSCLCSASYGHNILASTCKDGKLFLWNPKSGSSSPMATFKDAGDSTDYFALNAAKAHDNAIISLAVDASYGGEGPRWIATGGEDGFLKIWDTRMRRLLNVLACPSKAGVNGLEEEKKTRMPWFYDSEQKPSTTTDLVLKNSYYDDSLWEGSEVSNKDYIKSLKSSPDGRFLIRVDGTDEVAIYDTTTWQEMTAFHTDLRIRDCSIAILNQGI